MSFRIVGFSGSLSRPSRSRTLAGLAASQVADRVDGRAELFDLADLQPMLGAAARLEELQGAPRRHVDRLRRADALVIASPVHKGSYPGLFKHLFDLLDPADLAGKPVLLLANGGGEKHALMVEHQLRPLFAFFEAAIAPTAIYASPSDFTDGQPSSPTLLARLERGIAQLTASLAAQPREKVA